MIPIKDLEISEPGVQGIKVPYKNQSYQLDPEWRPILEKTRSKEKRPPALWQ